MKNFVKLSELKKVEMDLAKGGAMQDPILIGIGVQRYAVSLYGVPRYGVVCDDDLTITR